MKIISIIIATYNAGKTLSKCLDSILLQKCDEVELLIIDGGSKDNTLNIIEESKNKVDFALSEPDKGIYDAWNKGIKQARGQWIMFVGADDELMPDAIDNYLNILLTHNTESIDYICAQNELVSYDNNFLKKIGKEPSWSRMRYDMAPAHVASLHNKQTLFGQVGLFNLQFHICADYELLLRKKNNLKYLFFPEFTMAKMQEGGMSTSLKAVLETYKIRKYHKTISPILNLVVLVKYLLGYKLYKFHK